MQVLLVGPTDEPLFADVVASVHTAGRTSRILTLRTLDDLDRSLAPNLVLVLQQWPDEYPQKQIWALIDTYPLARMLVCYGPWCDSDGRTRDLWPHVVRVPVSVAASRLTQELDNLRHRVEPLPLTADRTETYIRQSAPPCSTPKRRLAIAVVSPDRALGESLRDVLAAAGHSPISTGSAPIDLLLWDADPWDQSSRRQLAHLETMHPGVPVVALCGFPRLHEQRELSGAGVAAVIPKLADSRTLVARLEQVAKFRSSVGR